ncbi:retinaldehyde-binding protein 1-like [Macrosteles quadrilineatus]|uniref:retinaldehyde-binding protein 1-like n=1 Tax=Macrosteles quadrilineatus TaxID=74068 RepID=UPI0023E3192A|nr:retinaldehyde-binding protein 1-like [Macrosteles quadrilineatus]
MESLQDKREPRDLQIKNNTHSSDQINPSDEEEPPDCAKEEGWVIVKEFLDPTSKEHRSLLSDIVEIPKGICGAYVLQVEVNQPGEMVLEKAKQELRETEEMVNESVAKLQELLKKEQEENGLIVPLENIAWLKRFLRIAHYYPESAFQKVKNYYKFKIEDKNKRFYENLKPSTEEIIFNHDIMTVLPNRDQHGRRILLVETGRRWKYNECSLDDIFKGSVIFLEAALMEPETQISGVVVIFDLDGLDAWQMFHFTINPAFIFRIVDLLQTASPIRIKSLHIINQPLGFGKLLKLFTILMSEKLQKRIHIHGADFESLHQHIDKDCLPPEYKGTCEIPRISGPIWLEALSMLDEEYDAVSCYGYKK